MQMKPDQVGELYHLGEDLSESRNLATENPQQVEQMKRLLEDLIVQGRSTPGAKQKNDMKVVRYPKSIQ